MKAIVFHYSLPRFALACLLRLATPRAYLDAAGPLAMETYLRLLAQRRLDTAGLITHRFRLEHYREAFLVGHQKQRHRAVKVVFDFQ